MADCDNLLAKARTNAKSMRFTELCDLAGFFGFVFDRQRGSHRIYTRKGTHRPMSFQNDGGMAKAYQVRQLLRAIDEDAPHGGRELI